MRGLHRIGVRHRVDDDPGALAARLPPAAARDLIEWGPQSTPEAQLQSLMDREVPLEFLLAMDPGAPALTDDRPVNEYFLLRHLHLWRY